MSDRRAALKPGEVKELENLSAYTGAAIEDLVLAIVAGYLRLLRDAPRAVPHGSLSEIVKRAKGASAT